MLTFAGLRNKHLTYFFISSGDQIVEVNGTHLRGMDQEDVIKIFRDLPSLTQMKIRRSRTATQKVDSAQKTENKKDSSEKPSAQEPVPLPKPPENRRRSSLRNKVQPIKQQMQEDKPSSSVNVDDTSSSEHPKSKAENVSSPSQRSISNQVNRNENRVAVKAEEMSKTANGVKNTPASHSTRVRKPSSDNVNTSEGVANVNSVELKDELGDSLIIPTGYRKMTVSIKKSADATLGISLVPSYGKLKGYFQVML